MGLNLNNSGNFTPHIRYMASTSSWSYSTENGQQPFTFTQAVFDLENIKTGWGFFGEGQAPEWVMDASLSSVTPKPQDGKEWKRGFKVNVFSKTMFGQESVRELATTATGAVMAIDALYDEYEQKKAGNEGKLPVVEFKGSVPKKVGKGNTTVPTLVVVKFVDRPNDFNSVSEADITQPSPEPLKAAGGSEF